MATLHAFDTLAYTKALVERGYERDKAEALAEAQREFFVKDIASEDFVAAEAGKIRAELAALDAKLEQKVAALNAKLEKEVTRLEAKIEHEILASENRMMKANAKMLAFAVGVMLAGIPLIQSALQRLG